MTAAPVSSNFWYTRAYHESYKDNTVSFCVHKFVKKEPVVAANDHPTKNKLNNDKENQILILVFMQIHKEIKKKNQIKYRFTSGDFKLILEYKTLDSKKYNIDEEYFNL